MKKLAHIDLELNIDLSKGKFTALIVENTSFFVECIEELQKLERNENSKFVFSENCTPKKLENFQFFTALFPLDLPKKKIESYLQKELAKFIELNRLQFETNFSIQKEMIGAFLMDINSQIYIADELDAQNYAKFFAPTVNFASESFFEQIIEIIDLYIVFFKTYHFAFLNLLEFLTFEQVEQLLQHCEYREISILFLENKHIYKTKKILNLVVYNDLCEFVEN